MSGSSQKEVFLGSEGDRFYERNRAKLNLAADKVASDPVLHAVRACRLNPGSILEIGCSNGWRLEALRREYGATCHGVDPSSQGIREGSEWFPEIALTQGTADALPFANNAFDLVIFGFCLYLCDRRDLFKIAAEADRVTRDQGNILILDFHPPFPYRNEYKHRPGVSTFKMQYANLFTWNPDYTVVLEQVLNPRALPGLPTADDRVSVTVLLKSVHEAYPQSPFASPGDV